jgi:hypothetical protein
VCVKETDRSRFIDAGIAPTFFSVYIFDKTTHSVDIGINMHRWSSMKAAGTQRLVNDAPCPLQGLRVLAICQGLFWLLVLGVWALQLS